MADAYCEAHGAFNFRRIWKASNRSIVVQTCPECDDALQGKEVVCPFCHQMFALAGRGVSAKGELDIHDLEPVADEDPHHRRTMVKGHSSDKEKRKRELATEGSKASRAVENTETMVATGRGPEESEGDLGDESYIPPDAPDA